MNLFQESNSIQKGDNEDDRLNFANNMRQFLIGQRINELNYNKKKEKRFLDTGNYHYKVEKNDNIPFMRMEPTSLSNVDFQRNENKISGGGRIKSNNIFNKILEQRTEDFKLKDLSKKGFLMMKPLTTSTTPGKSLTNNLINNMIIELESKFLNGEFEEIDIPFVRKLYQEIEKSPKSLSKEDIIKNASVLSNMIRLYFNPPDRFKETQNKVIQLPLLFNIAETVWLYIYRSLNLLVLINGNLENQNLLQLISGYKTTLAKSTIPDSSDLFNNLTTEYPLQFDDKNYEVALTNRYNRLLKNEVEKKSLSSIATDKRKNITTSETNTKKSVDSYKTFILSKIDTKSLDLTDEANIREILDKKTRLNENIPIYKNYTIKQLKDALKDILENRIFIQQEIDKLEEKGIDVKTYKDILTNIIQKSRELKINPIQTFDYKNQSKTVKQIYESRMDFYETEFQELLNSMDFNDVKQKDINNYINDINNFVSMTNIPTNENIYEFFDDEDDYESIDEILEFLKR